VTGAFELLSDWASARQHQTAEPKYCRAHRGTSSLRIPSAEHPPDRYNSAFVVGKEMILFSLRELTKRIKNNGTEQFGAYKWSDSSPSVFLPFHALNASSRLSHLWPDRSALRTDTLKPASDLPNVPRCVLFTIAEQCTRKAR
jgi:hypothetical protein